MLARPKFYKMNPERMRKAVENALVIIAVRCARILFVSTIAVTTAKNGGRGEDVSLLPITFDALVTGMVSTASILGGSSLLCLALGWTTTTTLLGIALLSVTLFYFSLEM